MHLVLVLEMRGFLADGLHHVLGGVSATSCPHLKRIQIQSNPANIQRLGEHDHILLSVIFLRGHDAVSDPRNNKRVSLSVARPSVFNRHLVE